MKKLLMENQIKINKKEVRENAILRQIGAEFFGTMILNFTGSKKFLIFYVLFIKISKLKINNK